MQNTLTIPIIEKLTFTLEEVQQILGVSRVTVWRLEKRGQLKSVSALRHKVYSRKAIERFLDGEAK